MPKITYIISQAKYRGGIDTTNPVQPQHTTLLSPLDYD